ncbi:MAG: lysophospholipase [Candidatus Limnocylindrales bacterium]
MAAPTLKATGSGGDKVAAPRSKWPAADGTPLHVREWPSVGEPWARVLIVHGIGEHSGRYQRTGRLMSEAGLDVQAFDLRGHGLSGGRRVYVRRWDDFLDDVEVRLAALRQRGGPIVLFGHSLGALIALTYACSERPAPDLLVLSAPPLSAKVPGWQRALAPILGRVAPTVVLTNPITADQLARDPAVGIAYFADPLVQPHSTTRLGAQFLAATRRARSALDRLTVPALVIHGGADTLVPTAASEPLGALPGVERRVLPNLRHETLNEPEGPEVVAQIVAWLREHIAGAPANGR